MKNLTALLTASLLTVSMTNVEARGGPHQKYVKDTSGSRYSFYVGAENFYWDEHDQGQKLLDESGYLYEAGLQLDNFNKPEKGVVYLFRVGIKGGTVDYDGATISFIPAFNDRPLKSETKYENLYIEYNAGYRFMKGSSTSFDLMGGLSHEQWRRIGQDGTAYTAGGTPFSVMGYTEEWGVTAFKATAGVNFLGDRWNNHIHAGVKAPLTVLERVDLFNADLEPNGQMAPFVEWSIDRLNEENDPVYGFTVYYEDAEFLESDVDNGVYQPDSRRITTGARVHWFF